MIGSRPLASAAIAIVALAVSLGPRTLDPSVGAGAQRLIRERAGEAAGVLDRLRSALLPAVDRVRDASAAVQSADESPVELIESASDLVADAEVAVVPARRAVSALVAAQLAADPDATAVVQPAEPDELLSISAQLRGSADAADAFVDLRRRATGLPQVLEDAFDALADGRVDEGFALVERARADHHAVVAWETDAPTLPVWIETTDAMITSVERMIEASEAGDTGGVTAAARDFADLADEAGTADRALRIAISETGSALTAVPLERLAAVLASVEQSRADVARVAAGHSP